MNIPNLSTFTIKNFHTKEAFNDFYNAKNLDDRCNKFKWMIMKRINYPNDLPTYAIKGNVFFSEEPKLNEIKNEN